MTQAAAATILSKKLVNELVECFSSFYVLRTIETAFDNANIVCDDRYEPTVSGQRRCLAHQYLHSLDLTRWSDAKKLLEVIEDVLGELDDQVARGCTIDVFEPEAHEARLRLTRFLKRDGFEVIDGKIGSAPGSSPTQPIRGLAIKLDSEYLRQQTEAMERAIDEHPSLAIGLAKELVETICKTILEERGCGDVPSDLAPLVKRTLKELKLVRDDIPEAAKAADTIRRMLSNLSAIPQGLAELRNLYGSGHGKSARSRGLRADGTHP